MQKLVSFLFIFGVLAISPLSFAHEGHDHEKPKTLKAPKGGVIKALDHSRVEVISKGSQLKIYIYDEEMKPASPNDFKIVAQAELPRKKSVEEIQLTAKDNFYEGSYDAKGSHRYALKLELTDIKHKQTDKLTFNIEPRK